MWRRKRRTETAPAVAALQPDAAQAPLEALEAPETLEALEAEIEQLTEANRATPDRDRERRLLALRHLAGIRHLDDRARDLEFAEPSGIASSDSDLLTEVAPGELTAGLLRGAILHGGCLLVRGLLKRDAAMALAEGIERAYEERQRCQTGEVQSGDYYREFVPDPRFGEVQGRWWIEAGGGLLAADSPRLHFEMIEQFAGCGLRELVSEYLNEPALISVHKTTLRRADPDVAGAWHQDGFFMGPVRSLNLWLSLSRCGDVAPGLDILPRRLDHYLARTAEDWPFDYTVSQEAVEAEANGTPLLRPIFEPGDALFFDEWFLHQTASDPSMPNPRYAIENWFFGGSGFPEEYAPIAV